MTAVMEAVVNGRRETGRIAPCGAPLATGRKRPLSGAPLYRRIEKQLRTDQLAGWNLPLDEYDCVIERVDPPGSTLDGWFISRSQEALEAAFTHRETGAKIIVTQIWVDDDGLILQWGSQYGDMVL